MMISKKAPDLDHPYGHGKAEVIGAGIVASDFDTGCIKAALMQPPHQANLLVLGAAAVSLAWK
ncbi:hypothetical protein ACFQ3J_20635 [Paenibacillus provencensis]|uniref:Uncharacterized protein n=1 Tax=Paenibacillus provencensis TaxID=441151 RepID=A0ABW3Q585_9BACL